MCTIHCADWKMLPPHRFVCCAAEISDFFTPPRLRFYKIIGRSALPLAAMPAEWSAGEKGEKARAHGKWSRTGENGVPADGLVMGMAKR